MEAPIPPFLTHCLHDYIRQTRCTTDRRQRNRWNWVRVDYSRYASNCLRDSSFARRRRWWWLGSSITGCWNHSGNYKSWTKAQVVEITSRIVIVCVAYNRIELKRWYRTYWDYDPLYNLYSLSRQLHIEQATTYRRIDRWRPCSAYVVGRQLLFEWRSSNSNTSQHQRQRM